MIFNDVVQYTRFLAVTALFCLVGIAACANSSKTIANRDDENVPPTAQVTVPALKDSFRNTFLIGTALNYDALQGKQPHKVAMAQKHFSAFTPGNSLKPDFTQAREGVFTFEQGDRLVDLAKQSGATVVGHTLVWHSQTPSWFFTAPDGKPVSRDLALSRMRTHIKTVVGHFKGRIAQWDVVNEAISDAPNEELRQTPWLKTVGEDYIEQAFRAAHEADPQAILIYNDYNIERSYKRPKAIQLLKSLLAKGVPIHAVGLQCHWRLDNPDLSEVEESIDAYAALGLKVMITEMDIGVLPSNYGGADISAVQGMTPEQAKTLNPYTQGLPEAIAQQQAVAYRDAFALFLRHQKQIGRITLWGIEDSDSWLNDFPIRGRTDYAMLFDRAGQPKPAFFAVVEAAKSTKH